MAVLWSWRHRVIDIWYVTYHLESWKKSRITSVEFPSWSPATGRYPMCFISSTHKPSIVLNLSYHLKTFDTVFEKDSIKFKPLQDLYQALLSTSMQFSSNLLTWWNLIGSRCFPLLYSQLSSFSLQNEIPSQHGPKSFLHNRKVMLQCLHIEQQESFLRFQDDFWGKLYCSTYVYRQEQHFELVLEFVYRDLLLYIFPTWKFSLD